MGDAWTAVSADGILHILHHMALHVYCAILLEQESKPPYYPSSNKRVIFMCIYTQCTL